MAQRNDVLVVGAGVIGLTTAVCLAEEGLGVRVRAGEAPADTTSAVAGAMVGGPVVIEPVEAAVGWNQTSLEEFEALAGQPDTGVRMARGRMVLGQGDGIPGWARSLPGFEECTPEEHAGFPVAFWMTSPLVDMPRYLGYLSDRLTAAGGEIEIAPLASLAEVAAEAPVIVNCTGTGARGLVDDPAVMAVRGQHVVVENPGLDDFFFERGPGPLVTSYMPHGKRLVLGGTVNPGDWSRQPDPVQTEEILRRCCRVEPRLADATVLSVEVGLRPGRPKVRLEEEPIGGAVVIHNYGHGGVGVGMSWGCARQVQQMVTSRQAARRAD